MLALSFTFPGGRYHATPWDRHVNEGAVAWPPEPWRILRGLIATWHHKVKHAGTHGESTLLALIESLTKELPEYRLPVASHSHTRHYMPQFAANDTKLIFDAFTAIKRDDSLDVVWPTLELPSDQAKLLDDLLFVMGYLGRAESWVEAKRLTDKPQTDCKPGVESLNTATGELRGEIVDLYAPLPASEYRALRDSFFVDARAAKKLAKTLPENLLDALSVDTADLRRQGWSQPPAARKVSYLRSLDALKPKHGVTPIVAPSATTASFILTGKPLPRVEDGVRIGELMRAAVMSQARHIFGEDSIPPIFSGHGLPPGSCHRHAFYLPWDSNGDGRIDRVLVHVPDGMDAVQQRTLYRVDRLWEHEGAEWRLMLESVAGNKAGGALTGKSTRWTSITPYLHPWHVKKRFTAGDQLRRECHERGMPELVGAEAFDEVTVGRDRKCRSIHFSRFRNRRGLDQPDRVGSFWRLTFSEPVEGPLALGFACHFGLGLFAPIADT
jgi:CRISPR-associated protein Csb2